MTAPTALVVIDMQMEFARRTEAGLPRSNPGAEDNIARLVALFRARGLPIHHVHHDDPSPTAPFRLDATTGAPMQCAAPHPGEAVHIKHGSSAFIGTDLDAALRAQAITHLVICGAAINYCVSSSVRMAANLGYDVTLPADATLGFGVTGADGRLHAPDDVLSMTLGTLSGDFAHITTTSALEAHL
jgi:nicotinamidase-related amidase